MDDKFQKLKEEIRKSLKDPAEIAAYYGIVLRDPFTLVFHVRPFPKSEVIDRIADKFKENFKNQNKTKEITLKLTYDPNRNSQHVDGDDIDNSLLYQWNLCEVREIHQRMIFEDIFNSIMESNKLTSKPKCEGFDFIHPWWFVNCHENMIEATSGGKRK